MKVYVLVGIKENDWEENFGDMFYYNTNHNHSLHPTRADARSAYQVAKVMNEWEYDDYDIEEHDL